MYRKIILYLIKQITRDVAMRCLKIMGILAAIIIIGGFAAFQFFFRMAVPTYRGNISLNSLTVAA